MGFLVIWPALPRSQPNPRVTPDLAFNFNCARDARTLEEDIEKFLKDKGFRVLNQARIQRALGLSVFDLLIMGLDNERRIFWFSALPRTKGRYTASLITSPPTRRSSDLEDAVLQLTSEQLGCEIRHISRGENRADAKEAFDRHYNVIEGYFKQARSLKQR
jgi:hypothetical protein